MEARSTKETIRKNLATITSASHHTARGFHTDDYDACFTPLGMKINALLAGV